MTHSLAILVTALLFGGMTLYSFGFAALLWWSHDTMAATVMAAVALTTIPVRQLLMPAINRATDSDDRLRFMAARRVCAGDAESYRFDWLDLGTYCLRTGLQHPVQKGLKMQASK